MTATSFCYNVVTHPTKYNAENADVKEANLLQCTSMSNISIAFVAVVVMGL